MKSILFFGDSNTWGYDPATGGRYPYEKRWTSIAQKRLGDGFRCIPAGLNGRTTVFDDPWKPCRNGRSALDIELQTHKPLDLVVIMLGTNDLKFGGAERAARGAETLVIMAKMANERFSHSSPVFADAARVLLVSPIKVHENSESNIEKDIMPDAHAQSMRLKPLYASVAKAQGVYFMAASDFAEPSAIDCQHMTESGHAAFGEAMAEKISEIFARG